MLTISGLFFLTMSLPAAHAVVNQPVANMYSTASEDSDVVSQTIFGADVVVLETAGDWMRIRTPDAYTGWVQRSAVVKPQGIWRPRTSVASLYAHVYREPSVTRHRPLLTLPFEARLQTAEGSDDRWVEVKLPDGRFGWIQRGDLTADPHPLDVTATVELSRRFLGLPYTWGGTSSLGYDCSGFTQMLLRQRGILMPRDAADQASWEGVIPVDKTNIELGDLLFFVSESGRITHTGMYLGSDQFIHATAHERPVIQISRLSDPHWTELFAGARRPK
jgi:hypothetical protein